MESLSLVLASPCSTPCLVSPTPPSRICSGSSTPGFCATCPAPRRRGRRGANPLPRRRPRRTRAGPRPTRQQSELIPGLRLDEAMTAPDAIGAKPRQSRASEMRLDRFAPRPFPGHRSAEGQRGFKTLKMSEGSEFASLFGRQSQELPVP
jgi:hypothetical protein